MSLNAKDGEKHLHAISNMWLFKLVITIVRFTIFYSELSSSNECT